MQGQTLEAAAAAAGMSERSASTWQDGPMPSATIAGVHFVHLMFQFVLAWSGWRHISIAMGETYEALVSGLQGAFWALGGVPTRVRQDNLSAATHERVETSGRALTKRFAQVVDHYGFEASRIEPGEAHQNGVVEKANDLLKTALTQALLLRGSRDFLTVDAYLAFARGVVDEKFHRPRRAELAQERLVLKPLPLHRLPEYTEIDVKVRGWSTVHVAKRIYSVPSRLIGHCFASSSMEEMLRGRPPLLEERAEAYIGNDPASEFSWAGVGTNQRRGVGWLARNVRGKRGDPAPVRVALRGHVRREPLGTAHVRVHSRAAPRRHRGQHQVRASGP